jgi:hypothetical protein
MEDESQYPLGSLLQDDSVAVISGTGAHAVGGINPLNAELNPVCHLLALLGKGKVHPCTGRTAHMGSRGVALPFHDHGTRRG